MLIGSLGATNIVDEVKPGISGIVETHRDMRDVGRVLCVIGLSRELFCNSGHA